MLTADERKLRGTRTRSHHRAADATQARVDEIEREIAANIAADANGSDPKEPPKETPTDRQDGSAVPTGVEPPDGLSELELKFWRHYAPCLRAQRRLTMSARDTLAGYCSALAIIAELRLEMAEKGLSRKDRSAARRELRQYLAIKRLYESDLLLNPATAARVPSFDEPPPIDPGDTSSNAFDDEFDVDDASTH